MKYRTKFFQLLVFLFVVITLSIAQKRLILKHPKMIQNRRSKPNDFIEYEAEEKMNDFNDANEELVIDGNSVKEKVYFKKYKKE